MLCLCIASYQDFKTGLVENLYPLSIGISITGLLFSFFTNVLLINIQTNIIIAIIIFVCTYTIYVLSNITNRNGWGGADVLILSSLSCGLGFYMVFVILISTFLSIIYTIFKSLIKKTNVFKTETRFLPFVFIATCIVLFFIIIL